MLQKRDLIDGLSACGVFTEEDGGPVPIVYVSALTGFGMDHLADTIVALDEVCEPKADFSGAAEGVIVETTTDISQG